MAWKVCVAAAIGLGTVACTDPGAPPLAVSTFSEAAVAPVGRVRYWGEYDEGVSYRSRPRRYDEPRRYERYNYDREAAKDYVKSYRRAQKDEFKAQVRGWNRAHGF